MKTRAAAGTSLLETVFAVALTVTVMAIAVPQVLRGLDAARAGGAARDVAMRMNLARAMAVARSVNVGLRFELTATGYQYTVHEDGNGNGIRTSDVLRRIDPPIGGPERLPYLFKGVDFGVLPGLPAVDSSSDPPGTDPIKLGSSNILSFSPLGSCTSGSVYLLGRGGAQYVIKALGETGRIRVLKFDARTRKWTPV